MSEPFHLYTGFFRPEQADWLLDWCIKNVPWEQRSYSSGAKQPRLTYWYGDKPYMYSGLLNEARPMPEVLEKVSARVAKELVWLDVGHNRGWRWNLAFNSVLLNMYRNGRDSIGAHSDDEPELGKYPTIASLSLGATRTFILHGASHHEIQLPHNSVLVMFGDCQAKYRHSIPKEPTCGTPRVNLTFRWTGPNPARHGLESKAEPLKSVRARAS